MDSKIVKMAHMQVGKNECELRTNSLGSCIAIVLYDRTNKIGGLAHIMLPFSNNPEHMIGKYANLAIPSLYKKMLDNGSSVDSIQAMIFGGANMFLDTFKNNALLIGEQNVEMSKVILKTMKINILFEDTGGNNGRNVTFSCADGSVTVSNFESPPKTYYFQ